MKQKDFEKVVTELAYVIQDLYKASFPRGNYINVSVVKDSIYIVGNTELGEDEYPINIRIEAYEKKHSLDND